MTNQPYPKPMSRLPQTGQHVRWRNPEQLRWTGWVDAFGAGPFEVVGLVDHSAQDIPAGLLLRTRRGEREINQVWLELTE